MYLIKKTPEDFVVEELFELHFDPSGTYSYYQLKKRNYTTPDAIKKIAEAFHVRDKFINVAGNKDKVAVTTQCVSISKGPERNLELSELQLTYLGKGKERLGLGSLQGNKFAIMVRNVGVDQKPRPLSCVINYFDDQRFGSNKDNHIIGQLLVERKFKEVCERLQLPVIRGDYIGALRKLSTQLLRMYIHAYQSYLWNEEVREYVSLVEHYDVDYHVGILSFPLYPIPDKSFPLYGFGNGHREFIFREFPELSQEGDERLLITEVKDFLLEQLDATTYKLMFILPKGSYATIVVKSLFGLI